MSFSFCMETWCASYPTRSMQVIKVCSTVSNELGTKLRCQLIRKHTNLENCYVLENATTYSMLEFLLRSSFAVRNKVIWVRILPNIQAKPSVKYWHDLVLLKSSNMATTPDVGEEKDKWILEWQREQRNSKIRLQEVLNS